MDRLKQSHRGQWIWIGVSFVGSAVLLVLSRQIPAFAEWYASGIFPIFPATIGRLMSFLPVSFYELLLFLLAAGLLILAGWLLSALFKKSVRQNFKRKLISLLRSILCMLGAAALLFTLGSGINYGRRPFSELAGFSVHASTVDELLALGERLSADAEIWSKEVPLDENGCFCLTEAALHQEARTAMASLGSRYNMLSGYYPNPKPVLMSKLLSRFNLLGVYAPLTIEANYNADATDYLLPFTVCHELSHLRGFMREDEAGFIAYLACMGSGSAEFRYSGTLNALTYVLNALYEVLDSDSYGEFYRSLPEQVQRDFQQNRLYWAQYEGKAAEFSDAVNDIYLKANAQVEGVRSYGRMVDLLLAYYREAAPV